MKTSWEPKIVVLGGGTGLSVLLRGLKKYTPHLTAIVTVTDDGGSSGTLRRELGVLPPGDIRNCLVALSEEENLMAQLFQYRFPAKGALAKHSFGNLFLTAMSALSGGFDKGIARAGEVLAIHGKVLPVTLSSVTLEARLTDGRLIQGETNIARSNLQIDRLTIRPTPPPAGPRVIEAIADADAVIIGPGSLYTSIISNLLVKGVVLALRRTRAPKIYVSNIMTQPGETTGYTTGDHLTAIDKHGAAGLLDFAIVNSGVIAGDVLRRYARKKSFPVAHSTVRVPGLKMVRANMVSPDGFARHDPGRLSMAIMKIVSQARVQ
jgi:uncharacterized cofD-like protein